MPVISKFDGIRMKTDVSLVKALDGHQIEVTLQDGRHGRFDMTPYLGFNLTCRNSISIGTRCN